MSFSRTKVRRPIKFVLSFLHNECWTYSSTIRARIPSHKSDLHLPQVFGNFHRPFSISCIQHCITEVPYVDPFAHRSTASQKKIIPPAITINRGQIAISGQLLGSLKPNELNITLNKFHVHKLKPEFLDKYNVRISESRECLMFPLCNTMGDVLAVQYLDSSGSYPDGFSDNLFPSDSYPALYGWSPDFLLHNILVITSNPVDAIAINQETNIAAVSFPFENNHFPTSLFKLLEQFDKIILWFSELRNWMVHKLFIEKLDKKAFIISAKKYCAPLLALENGSDIGSILKAAKPLKHEGVETCSDYRASLYDQFKNHDKYSGLKWQRFSPLNAILKGHRPGELTLFSGQTGTGKTTFMSEYSLDLCMQGLYTLWGSFELPNHRLLNTMLTQFSSYSLRNNLDKFDIAFSEFSNLPMSFIKFNADTTLNNVIETMTFMVEDIGVQHIVIDNLQFMLNNERMNSFVDHWHRQDQIYGAFRRFATIQNCHITLIMHPRKEPEFSELHSTSISGNAKAIQEADNILILQTTKARQYLEITKNRFDGEKGCILLEFNQDSLTYTMKKCFKTS